MENKKIIFFLPSYGGGGAEQVFIRLLNHFTKKGIKASVFIKRNKGEHFGRLNGDVKSKISSIDWLPISVIEFIFYVWKVKPDLVFITTTYPIAAIGALRKLLPSSSRIIGRFTNMYSEELKNVKSNMIKKILPSSIMNFDRIICQSIDMKEDLLANIPRIENKIRVINNPVPTFQKKNLFRENYICVGRLSKQKNFDLAIKAFASTNKILNIYGIGPEEKKLKKLISNLNCKNVIIHGFVEDIIDKISSSKGLVVTSNFEGFSNVIIEALACGTPIISRKFKGGFSEALNQNNSVIFEGSDPEDLINAVDQFESKVFDKDKISSETYEKFGIEKISQQYIEL